MWLINRRASGLLICRAALRIAMISFSMLINYLDVTAT
jgi:hypothetical protein